MIGVLKQITVLYLWSCFHAQLIATKPYFQASANEIQSLKSKDIEILEIDDSELIDEGIVEVGSDDEGAELVGVMKLTKKLLNWKLMTEKKTQLDF